MHLQSINTSWIITFLIIIIFQFDSHAEILDYSTKSTFSRGVLTSESSFTIQINNKDERSRGKIRIPHGDRGHFKILYAEIVDRYGNVIQKLTS